MKVMLVYDLAATSTRDVADGVRDGFRSLGHEVIPVAIHQYAQLMFARWADCKPNEVPDDARRLIYGAVNKLILAEAIIHRPQMIYVVTGWTVSGFALEQIKVAIPCYTVVHLTESPYMDDEQLDIVLPCYDLVLCNERTSVARFAKVHDNVRYMPHSFNPNVHAPAPAGERDLDVFFCATGFEERMRFFGSVDWRGIDLYLAGLWPHAERYGIPAGAVHESAIQNRELVGFYARAKVCVNQHRTSKAWCEEVASGDSSQQEYIDHAESLGPRVFEVMACGRPLLTDWRDEFADLGLEDGVHMAIYRSPEEFGERVRYLLANAGEREAMAERGAAVVRAGCSFSSRLTNVVLPQYNAATKGD